MHIDMDSCFATIEQQANPLLRGKPVVVAAYDTPRGFILSASVEAKKVGIKGLMSISDAKNIHSDIIVRTPDPPMIRDVHKKMRAILEIYSPTVVAKSIDEFMIDFEPMKELIEEKVSEACHPKPSPLLQIGREIKQRMKDEIGNWISCSIGIGTNRFLAKMGASLGKPDGLELITHENVLDMYSNIELVDLYGINVGYKTRLNMNGIMTPLQFFQAPVDKLQKLVFKSVCGYYWFMRLRGWEVDAVEFARKSYGQQYALAKATDDPAELSRLLMKLCEKMGRRLRHADKAARGIHVGCNYKDWTFWHHGQTGQSDLYTTSDLFKRAREILEQQPERKIVRKISVQCFNLVPAESAQISLFDSQADSKQYKLRSLSAAADKINDKYGEFTVTPAFMMNMNKTIIDSIAFGRVKELQNDL